MIDNNINNMNSVHLLMTSTLLTSCNRFAFSMASIRGLDRGSGDRTTGRPSFVSSVVLLFSDNLSSFEMDWLREEGDRTVSLGVECLWGRGDWLLAPIMIKIIIRITYNHGNNNANDKNTHRGINVDHGTNIDQHSKPRNKCKYSTL
jgi:hypothetical protein